MLQAGKKSVDNLWDKRITKYFKVDG